MHKYIQAYIICIYTYNVHTVHASCMLIESISYTVALTMVWRTWWPWLLADVALPSEGDWIGGSVSAAVGAATGPFRPRWVGHWGGAGQGWGDAWITASRDPASQGDITHGRPAVEAAVTPAVTLRAGTSSVTIPVDSQVSQWQSTTHLSLWQPSTHVSWQSIAQVPSWQSHLP